MIQVSALCEMLVQRLLIHELTIRQLNMTRYLGIVRHGDITLSNAAKVFIRMLKNTY